MPAPSPHLRELEALLVSLRRGVRELGFYPDGHPSLQQSLDRLGAQLREALEAENPLTFTVTREGFAHSLGPVASGNPTVKAFAADLFQCQIRRIYFGRSFTIAELKAFLAMAGKDPKKLLMEGGAEAALAAAQVRNIQVNQLRFTPGAGDAAGPTMGGVGLESGGEDGTDAIAPVQGEELKEAPVQSAQGSLDGTGETAGGAAQRGDLLLEAANAQLVIEEESLTLDELLERLETAQGLTYTRLARRLDGTARRAMQTGNLREFLRLCSIMARHRGDPHRPAEARLAAGQWLEGIAQGGGLDFLGDQLCQKEPDDVEGIMGLLAALGQPALDFLIARLSLEENMAARRRLIAAIVRFRDAAVPSLLRGLEDERWFFVRNMAAILGELGHEDAVQALGRHLRHPDRRVRRELARAIAKIGGRQAVRLLRGCLADEDLVVRQTCVGFLAGARDAAAVRGLMAIAGERRKDKEGQELRKVAILALGQIGERSAVPFLVRTLVKRSWFRRAEPREIRAAAAAALGALGGPEAVAALQRVRDGGGPLGQLCREALARLGG